MNTAAWLIINIEKPFYKGSFLAWSDDLKILYHCNLIYALLKNSQKHVPELIYIPLSIIVQRMNGYNPKVYSYKLKVMA